MCSFISRYVRTIIFGARFLVGTLSHNSGEKVAKKVFKISAEANGNNAVIRIDGGIYSWKDSAKNFRDAVNSLVASGIKDATVYINSEGGDPFQANEICNELKKFTGNTTAMLGVMCASSATVIACGCKTVIAAPNSFYMIHKPAMCTEGTLEEIKADLKLLEAMQNQFAKMYADKTGMKVTEIEAMWGQDYWMDANEALTKGFVDSIDDEEAEVTEDDVEAMSAYKKAPKITATAKTQNQNNNLTETDMNKDLIIMALGMDPKSTDAQVTAALTAMAAKAAKYDAVSSELGTLKTTAIEEKAELTASAAVTEKKITAAQKDFYKKNLIADFAGTKAQIDALPALTALSSHLKPEGEQGATEDRSKWTYADYQDKNPEALAELAAKDEAKFNVLAKAHFGKHWKG